MKPVVIHSEASKELDGAIHYYETQKPGLGLDFLAEIERIIDRIQQNPNIGAIYKLTDLRRYPAQRFPFLVFYSDQQEFIWIVAIAHSRRKPRYWQERMS